MSENTQNQEIEFDLNDLPELPEFIQWPAGSYDVTVESLGTETVSFGADKEVPCVSIKVKLVAINETKPANAPQPAIGAVNSWNFPLIGDDEEKTKMSQGRVRNLLMPFAIAFGTTNNVEIYQKAVGSQIKLITSVRVKKGDKLAGEEDKVYSGIKSVIIE